MTKFAMQGRFTAHPGKRDELLGILLEHSGEDAMPGCEMYLVCKSLDDENAICITEVWDSAESHAASLEIPSVRQAIGRAMPLIADMSGDKLEPVGELQLPRR